MKELRPSQKSISIASIKKNPRNLILDILIAFLVVLVGYLSYSLLDRHFLNPPVEAGRSGGAWGEIIQIDVLNGCGASGMASTFTAYLRARGYDVVETRNYKTFDMEESIIVDRTGNIENARKVAHALGVRNKNIVQQINPDYYVDVSVVIGKDYSTLGPSH
jgi:hypothetical protein